MNLKSIGNFLLGLSTVACFCSIPVIYLAADPNDAESSAIYSISLFAYACLFGVFLLGGILIAISSSVENISAKREEKERIDKEQEVLNKEEEIIRKWINKR